jgi:MFS family permease
MKGWRAAAFAVCAVGWGANQFAPMLLWYRDELALSAATVQATFAMYAVGLIPGLLLGGPVSDRIGRSAVVVPALAVSPVATLLLVGGQQQVALLFTGRLLAGAVSGAAFSAGSAWIKELSAPPYDDAPDGAGARRATVAMTIGFGIGPLVTGLLAQWAPAAGTLPYVPHLTLTLPALALAWRAPETAGGRIIGRRAAAGSRHPRFRWVVLPLAPWVFGSATIGFAYLPGLVIAKLHGLAIVFGGVVTLLTALAGVAVQPAARRLDRPGSSRLLAAGLGTVIAGVLLATGAAAAERPWLVVAATTVLGAAYGLCLVCGLLEVQRLTPPGELARTTALFQAASYLGFAAPYLLSALPGSPPTRLAGTAALAALTLAATFVAARRFPAPPPAPPEGDPDPVAGHAQRERWSQPRH